MLTKLTVRNFKLFNDVEIELGDRVVLIGPNNAGKTSALQALALWNIGVKRWAEKRGSGDVPEKRPGVTINRRDLIAVPVPTANLLWRDLHTQISSRESRTQKIFIDVIVEGVSSGEPWRCGLEFYYANEESFYCRAQRLPEGGRMTVPEAATRTAIAYLPPMSGLAASETRLDEGAINVRLGEGRTAEVLRNLCFQILQRNHGDTDWNRITDQMSALFGITLERPEYIRERGEIVMSYRAHDIRLDMSASGRGQQQILLLLAHMTANPGAVLLLDEPDAHLEILRQRQIYQILTDTAASTGSQIIAASHSEVLLNEAADRDIVIAFVGKPHRIDDRGSQVAKALKAIGFEQYALAEEAGWVLYLEGSTDLAILRALAKRIDHTAAQSVLERPFVQYVGNLPSKAQAHFHALREAKADLCGIAVYDRLSQSPPDDPYLTHATWGRREIENYLCQRDTLLRYAERLGSDQHGDLFGQPWRDTMATSIEEIESALGALGKLSPWSPDIKVTEDFLDPLFKNFFEKLRLPNLMRKTDYHTLAPLVAHDAVDPDVVNMLDRIIKVAGKAVPRRD